MKIFFLILTLAGTWVIVACVKLTHSESQPQRGAVMTFVARTDDTMVWRFEDGGRICYLAERGSSYRAPAALSCK